ncbi:VCBS repeat-containing protein [Caloramator sp. E03]|uniref:VCBS repeat-containing protein n=1 Tax=Caloramator sp. E03 TaxID=2576307 RepID=UPI0011101478|nr:VCBS repeat-containing protein [Caloramator sp. E03]QCX34164.1 VCBS repeat-containing protein [Caloramator sp. E03]
MYSLSPYRLNNSFSDKIYVIDFKQGDINGDLIEDNVFLLGQKIFDDNSNYIGNITLIIQDGRTNKFHTIMPKQNSGYNPTIFLGNFTDNNRNDILISIDSGGSGGLAYYYIYSFINNTFIKIFDYEEFNKKYNYKVTYLDFYQVIVIGSNSQKYTIDIKYKGKEYLSEIYDSKGKLKEPIEGWVNPLGGLYPVDFDRDGIFDLYAMQRIAGRYNADSLGYVQTSLKWKEKDFAPFFQTVGIFG